MATQLIQGVDKTCLDVRIWRKSSALTLPLPPSRLILISPVSVDISKTIVFGRCGWFISPLTIPIPDPSSSSEFGKTSQDCSGWLLWYCSSHVWSHFPCLGLVFQTRVNYLPVLATKSCVIQNINLKYQSNQDSTADTIYALQIWRQIKGWIIIIPTH